MDEFDRFAQATLTQLGVALGEGDLDVLRIVSAAFAPAIAALDAVDLAALEPELVIDPSRAPA